MNLHKIEQEILSYTKYIKEIEVSKDEAGYLFATIYPDFESLREAKIINIEDEIKWYAIELYNMYAKESQKIKGYKILTSALSKKELHVANNREPNDEIYAILKSYLRALSKNEVLLSSHIELDLGLDSLNYVELFVFVEQSFGVKIDEALFSKMMSVESLYMYIKQNKIHVKQSSFSWDKLLAQSIDEKLVYSPFIMFLYKILLYPLFKLYFRLEVKGIEHIPSSAAILAPSHQSMLDGFLVEATLPYKVLKRSFFLAYKQVFGTKLLAPIAKHGQTILIDANENLKHTMQMCAMPLKEGNSLVIFPEGARTRDGELLEFRPFFAMLSKNFNLPVVPIVIEGSFEALRAGMFFARPKKVKVTFLPPIEPKGLSYDEITKIVKEAISDELCNMRALNKTHQSYVDISNLFSNKSNLNNNTSFIAAHRGARFEAPENTLLALKKSIGRYDFIEIDVQLSSDGVVIVMHDDTLERTTNVRKIDKFKNRKPYRVCDFTLDELGELNYADRFYRDQNHKEPLLTLRLALEFIKENNLFLNIEIKDMHNIFSDEKVVNSVLDEVVRIDVRSSVLISSFRHEYLKIFKEIVPNIPTAALVEGKHPEGLLEYLRELKVNAYHLNDELVDKKTTQELREAGFIVGVYVVNDTKRAKELFNMGVNYIFSDIALDM